MPAFDTFVLFGGIALLFAMSPGPNLVFVLSRSINFGPKNGLITTLGIGTGGVIYTLSAALGVSALLATSTIAFMTIKYLGATYLIYLGIRVIFDKNYKESLTRVKHQKSIGHTRTYRDGIITTLLNPKAALYYLSFVPQFVDTSLSYVKLQLIILGLIQNFAAVLVYSIIAVFSGYVSGLIQRNQTFVKIQQILTGCTFILLGLSVAA